MSATQLGEKIGEGAMADVHAWAPGQVLKLFKLGVDATAAEHEARMTRAAFAAGAPAPEILGEVTLDGRFGLVLPRFEGPTMLQLLLSGRMPADEGGRLLAGLHHQVHLARPHDDLPSLTQWARYWMIYGGRRLPPGIEQAILAFIAALPPGDGLCHADLHPGNVIVTADGPRAIDWTSTVRAPFALDLARTHHGMTERVDADVDAALPRALLEAYLEEYGRLSGRSQADLAAAIAPYQPLWAALALAETGPTDAQRRRLEAIVRAHHSP